MGVKAGSKSMTSEVLCSHQEASETQKAWLSSIG